MTQLQQLLLATLTTEETRELLAKVQGARLYLRDRPGSVVQIQITITGPDKEQ